MTRNITCPHCGGAIEINPASLLAQRVTPARRAASRENVKKAGGRPRGSKDSAPRERRWKKKPTEEAKEG